MGTESKLHPDVPTYSIFLPSYTVFRKDRNANGGGVFQAIKSDLVCVEEVDFSNDICEILWSSLKIGNNKTLYLSSFYRPPNSSSEILDCLGDSISEVFTKIPHHPNIIIGGDFNLGDVDWHCEIPTTSNHSTASQHNKLLHLMDDYSLTQHVKVPTRPASGKTLDLLLSTYPNSVSGVFTSPGLSDHHIVNFEVNLKATRFPKHSYRVYEYKKANFGGLNEFIAKSSSEFIASDPRENSVEHNWDAFKNAVIDGISQYAPQKSSKPKYKLPWITPMIKREMRRKDRLHRKAVRSKNEQHWNAFKSQRNQVAKLIKESHNRYLNEVIGDSLTGNPKKFWSYVKHSKSENFGISPLKTEDGVSITDKNKAETLNSYFFSVFIQERLPLPQMSPSPFCPIADLLFSPDGVAKQLAKLNPYKACGPDNLPARVLKEISQSASTWLAFIFQQSFDLGVVPSDWSKALVTAVFKRENKSDPSNYRPISLTSICCKVMEHIVLSHMAKHSSGNNILINEQHGFRQQFSCETQLISALHDWAKSINSRSQTDVTLLDFSKAFDSVLHQRLLLKLVYYGIRGNMLMWIKAFLSNRSQSVLINGTQSSSKPGLSGVPQGSVLGPVLFLLYINDIPSSVKSSLRLFADDCILYREIHDAQDCWTLQDDLKQLSSWSNTWQLHFNVKKCYHLGITCKKPRLCFNILWMVSLSLEFPQQNNSES